MILEQCTFTGTPISSDPASSQSLLQLGVRLERIWSTGKHFIQDQTAASKETSQEKEMQYLQIVSEQPAPILGDQRRSHRQQVSQLLAVTAKGSGRIIDINSGGISFHGCFGLVS